MNNSRVFIPSPETLAAVAAMEVHEQDCGEPRPSRVILVVDASPSRKKLIEQIKDVIIMDVETRQEFEKAASVVCDSVPPWLRASAKTKTGSYLEPTPPKVRNRAQWKDESNYRGRQR